MWAQKKLEIQKINHPKWGWGSKIKILALLTKLNQILYLYSVDPQKARYAKAYHPKWGRGSKKF